MKAQSNWLVKSSGRILGPLTTERVSELLRSREISILDEVSMPMRRWQTIQYHPHFKDLIESLRKSNLSERTEATWTPTGTNSNLTQTVTDLMDSELTGEVTPGSEAYGAAAREIVIHDLPEQSQVHGATGKGRFQYGANSALQRQVERTTRGMWVATVTILVAVAAFILFKRYGGGDGRSSPQNLKQNVIGLVQIGHYAEALKELKSHYSDPGQAGELGIYYGSLLIQVEGQTVLGRRFLNAVIASRRPEVKQAYTALGLADLLDGQLDAADENFNKAIGLDREYVPALVNRAVVSLQKGDYKKAKDAALVALKLSPFQGEALLLLAEAQLYLYKADSDGNELDRINGMLKQFRSRQWDFAPELDFYRLYFDFLKQDHRAVEEKVQAFLDSDPRLTADHRHNVFIYNVRSFWKVMIAYCEKMAEQMGENPRVSALRAACHAQDGRWDVSRRLIEQAVHQSPKDPLIQAWYSYVLKESGEADQASVILGRAMEFNRKGEFVLPVLMQARFCQLNGDVDCARQSWQRIYERSNLDHLPAMAGIAWAHQKNKSFNEAGKMIDKGLRISPDYIPFLVMRQQAEAGGGNVGP